MATLGGSIIPATAVTGRKVIQGPAIRVYNAAGSTRKVFGGHSVPIIIITNADIGNYKVAQGEPIPIVHLARGQVRGGAALPVYPVDADGNYDATF